MAVLTLKDIQNDQELQEYGVQPGDELTDDGELIRNYSEIQDRQSLGTVITEEDITANPWMEEDGVEPGDRYVEGEAVYKDKSSSSYEQFMYHYEKTGGLTGYLRDAATIYTGMDFYKIGDWRDSDEKYGEGFSEASPEERREMIYRYKERELAEEFGTTFQPDSDSAAAITGGIVGEIVDPTSLLPIGLGLKGATIAGKTLSGTASATIGGGVLGGTFSVAEDLSKTGDVDPVKAAITGTVGAVLPAGIGLAGRKIAQRSAEKTINKVQDAVNKAKADPSDVITAERVSELAEEIGITPAKFTQALHRTKMTNEDIVNIATPEFSVSKGIAKDSGVLRVVSEGADKYLGAISTRIRNISEPILGALRRTESHLAIKTQQRMSRIRPFQQELAKIKGPLKDQVSRTLANGQFDAAIALMNRSNTKAGEIFTKEIKPLLTELKDELDDVGFSFKGIEDYFPRNISQANYTKWQKRYGNEKDGIIQKAKDSYLKKLQEKDSKVKALTEQQEQDVINGVLMGRSYMGNKPLPDFVRKRSIEKIDGEQLQYYDLPEQALEQYIRRATNEIEVGRFFGNRKKLGRGTEQIDLESTVKTGDIGKVLQKELDKLSSDDQNVIRDLLHARFVSGQTPLGNTFGAIRDLGYMYTIANPMSALVQLGDVAVSAALRGSWNTLTSLMLPKRVKLSQVLDDTISKEFADPSLFAKALEKSFKVSGFKMVDKLGKETILNAALKSNTKLVRSDKGIKKFREKWSGIMGDEIDVVIDDLKAGNVTDNVKFLLFNELSDFQPISLSEFPQGYLEAGKSKVLYMLKSFALKQMDVVRREVIQEYKKGNKGQAALKAFRIGAYLSASGLTIQQTKQILSGKETANADELPSEALWNLLGVYGLSKYTSDKYLARGEISQAVANTLAPPMTVVDTLAKGTTQGEPEKLLKLIPVFGGLLYNWLGGGAEKYNEYLEKTRK